MSYESLPDRLAAVRERIAAAAETSGRAAGAVTLVAVTKTLPADAVVAGAAAGIRDFGENYVQEALAKKAEVSGRVGDASGLRWHMIGHLQSNKAAVAARSFALLHGVDSLSVVRAVARAAEGDGPPIADLLLQIKLGGGAVRGGVGIEQAEAFLHDAAAFPHARFVGLMAVADPDQPARPQFALLRQLFERLRDLRLPTAPLAHISAGMSGDFEDAVAEGATIVRVGTALFGAR